jgi:hypothetical protein
MIDPWVIVAVAVVVATLLALLVAWSFRRSAFLLEEWAVGHHYQVLDRHYCWFCKGPFTWTSSNGQAVYRVTVADERGNRRCGWVRCGGWFWGLLSDQVEARWDP